MPIAVCGECEVVECHDGLPYPLFVDNDVSIRMHGSAALKANQR